jgi:hypothetical protein
MEIYLPFRVEHEVFKLVETIKKQSETIEQLERKLANEDKILTGTGHLVSQHFIHSYHTEVESFFL